MFSSWLRWLHTLHGRGYIFLKETILLFKSTL